MKLELGRWVAMGSPWWDPPRQGLIDAHRKVMARMARPLQLRLSARFSRWLDDGDGLSGGVAGALYYHERDLNETEH